MSVSAAEASTSDGACGTGASQLDLLVLGECHILAAPAGGVDNPGPGHR
jgi:hypothetical protein